MFRNARENLFVGGNCTHTPIVLRSFHNQGENWLSWLCDRVEWIFTEKKKLETCHVVPNCYRNQIPTKKIKSLFRLRNVFKFCLNLKLRKTENNFFSSFLSIVLCSKWKVHICKLSRNYTFLRFLWNFRKTISLAAKFVDFWHRTYFWYIWSAAMY